MTKTHDYSTRLVWTGNQGGGTSSYTAYGRDYTVAIDGKPELRGSSDPMFRGNPELHNPEDLFVAALSACHMLTYLALCAKHRISVVAYEDAATGTLELTPEGGGKFREVTLNPVVTITDAEMESQAIALHDEAYRLCFIAQSCSVPIHHVPRVRLRS